MDGRFPGLPKESRVPTMLFLDLRPSLPCSRPPPFLPSTRAPLAPFPLTLIAQFRWMCVPSISLFFFFSPLFPFFYPHLVCTELPLVNIRLFPQVIFPQRIKSRRQKNRALLVCHGLPAGLQELPYPRPSPLFPPLPPGVPIRATANSLYFRFVVEKVALLTTPTVLRVTLRVFQVSR